VFDDDGTNYQTCWFCRASHTGFHILVIGFTELVLWNKFTELYPAIIHCQEGSHEIFRSRVMAAVLGRRISASLFKGQGMLSISLALYIAFFDF